MTADAKRSGLVESSSSANHYPSLSFSSCGDLSEPTTPPPGPMERNQQPQFRPPTATAATINNKLSNWGHFELNISQANQLPSLYHQSVYHQSMMTPPEDRMERGFGNSINGAPAGGSSIQQQQQQQQQQSLPPPQAYSQQQYHAPHSHHHQLSTNAAAVDTQFASGFNRLSLGNLPLPSHPQRHQSSVSFDSSFAPTVLGLNGIGASSASSSSSATTPSLSATPTAPSLNNTAGGHGLNSRFFYNEHYVAGTQSTIGSGIGVTQPASPLPLTSSSSTSSNNPQTHPHPTHSQHQRGLSKEILKAETTDDEFPILVRRESYTRFPGQQPLPPPLQSQLAGFADVEYPFESNNMPSSSPMQQQRRAQSVSGTSFMGSNNAKYTPRVPFSELYEPHQFRTSYFPSTSPSSSMNSNLNATGLAQAPGFTLQQQHHQQQLQQQQQQQQQQLHQQQSTVGSLQPPQPITLTAQQQQQLSQQRSYPDLMHHRSTGSLPSITTAAGTLSLVPTPVSANATLHGPIAPASNPLTPSSSQTPVAAPQQMRQSASSATSQDSSLPSSSSGGVKPRSSKQSMRREDATANRFVNAELESFVGEIYSLCKDQHGCRFLQKKLEELNPKYTTIVFEETYPHVIELMTDPFGNYLCQKLLEHSNDEQRTTLIRTAAPEMVKIALNQHGTRALQKMIEFITLPEQVDIIVEALKKNVVRLIKDLNGNHVVQKCLNRLSTEGCQFIFDAVSQNCVAVGTHRHGCCVLQRCIDHANEAQKHQLVQVIIDNAYTLVQDPFGNYVTQYVLDLEREEFTSPLVEQFVGSVCDLSMQKFSSNVVEKCLRLAPSELSNRLIEELVISGDDLERLLRDSYANYVIQTALDYAAPDTRQRLVESIRPILPSIKATPYGRRIQTRLAVHQQQQSPTLQQPSLSLQSQPTLHEEDEEQQQPSQQSQQSWM